MGIIFKEETKEFHLFNPFMSYIIHILPNGHMGQLYCGKRVSTRDSYLHLFETKNRALTAYVFEDDDTFSLQHTRQEYATYGSGDILEPAFDLRKEDGSWLAHFTYQDHRIFSGKEPLAGLPATYVEEETEATSLEIRLYDAVSQTNLYLQYTIFEDRAVLTRSARFEQIGSETVRLERALSMTLDLPEADYQWLHLDGAWGRERQVTTSPLHQGTQSIYSLKGASSSEHNPFLALSRPQADEHTGEVWGFSLVYSGNFLAQVDVTPYEQARVSLGIHPHYFTWNLREGESFQTPEVVMVYSSNGFNQMSQTYHSLYSNRLVRGQWRDRERPVLLNNWEAMTFHFDEEKILQLAEKAAAVGVELFVMDDGWFGARNHDHAGLGDWTVNRNKLPRGLTGVIESIHQMGMKFGLWIEPEMVNKDSDLYRAHPDWLFHHPRHSQSQARHQYTLNLAREDVYQNIYTQLHQLLAEHEIDYIKWDMNRYMAEVYSLVHDPQEQGELFHRYILNIYRLYEALTSEFPHILFESCSSGGARFDPGMLYYAPQTWTSDDSDAIERLKIQYGTSMVYPLSSMGCHVSAVPNQQVNRMTPLSTRAHVAYFGNFGYELDLSELTPTDIKEVKEQINFYKRHRAVFQKGQFTRLLSPFTPGYTAWQVLSEAGDEVFVGVYRDMIRVNEGSCRLYLKGLEEEADYCLNGRQTYSGSHLMHAGIPLVLDEFSAGAVDFTSNLYHLVKVEKA